MYTKDEQRIPSPAAPASPEHWRFGTIYDKDEQRWPEFFARLANIKDLDELSKEDRDALVAEFSEIRGMSRLLDKLRRYVSDARDPNVNFEDDEKDILETEKKIAEREEDERNLFRLTYTEVQRAVLPLLSGEEVRLPSPVVFGRLNGRVLEEVVKLPTLENIREGVKFPRHFTYAPANQLYQLLRRRPFPFGQCVVCTKVFIQPRKGKPRRYCSTPCKAKGIPSAAKQTEYARTWRHNKRAQEIETTRRILLAWPEPEQHVERVKQEFLRKSRRQVLYLVKRAKSESQPDREEV